MSDEVKSTLQKAIAGYRDAGCQVVEVSLPHMKYAVAAYYIIATAEASSNLARYDGIRYGQRRCDENDDLLATYLKTREHGFGMEVKRRILLGTFVLSSGYYDAYYQKAQRMRTLIRKDFEEAFKICDAILMPVTPTPAFKVGEKISAPRNVSFGHLYHPRKPGRHLWVISAR